MNGVEVDGLTIQFLTVRPPHLVCHNGAHDLDSQTLRYFKANPETPFRPAKLGPYLIRRVEIGHVIDGPLLYTEAGVRITTDGGYIHFPEALVAYSVANPKA